MISAVCYSALTANLLGSTVLRAPCQTVSVVAVDFLGISILAAASLVRRRSVTYPQFDAVLLERA